jgi:Putative metallopeptidase domain
MFLKKDDRILLEIYQRILVGEQQSDIEDRDELESELGKENAFEKALKQVNKIQIPKEEFRKLKDRILMAKRIVRKKAPGLAFILDNMKTVFVKDDPEMTTMAVDNFRNIYIDIDFMMKTLDLDETAAVLAHEACHIANKTFIRRRGRNPLIWNYATDFSMNLALITAGFKLPKGDYCIPVKVDGRFHVKKKKLGWDFDIDDLKAERIYQEIYDLIKKGLDGQEPPTTDPTEPQEPQEPPKTKKVQVPIQVSDVIVYTNKQGKKVYGTVYEVDEASGELEFDEISREEALRLAKENDIKQM